MEQPSLRVLTPRVTPCAADDYVSVADLPGRTEVIFYEDLPDREQLEPGLYVFTGLNRLGPRTAELFADLHDQLRDGTGIEPLNHPLRTLRRYELLRMLSSEGLNDFTAIGAWEDFSALRFPAFVRPREVDGTIPELLHSPGEVERAVGAFVLDGWRPEELLAVEFEDVADTDGRYEKYSAFVIGERVVPVSLDVGGHWVLRRNASESGSGLAEASYRYVADNPHEEQLTEIFRKSHTQFGRIDYSMKGDRVQTWEINTLPTLRPPPGAAPPPADVSAREEPRRVLVRAAFSRAWHELVDHAPMGRPIRPRFDPETVHAAREEMAQREGMHGRIPRAEGLSTVRAILRPFKPILKPLAANTLYPLLAWLTRR